MQSQGALTSWALSAAFFAAHIAYAALMRAGDAPALLAVAVFVPLVGVLKRFASHVLARRAPSACEHLTVAQHKSRASKGTLALAIAFTLAAVGASLLPKRATGSRFEAPELASAAAAAALAVLAYLYWRRGRLDMKALNAIADRPMTETDKRRTDTYPAAYPNGWYKLLDSCDLLPGQVQEVKCLGRVFALFRTESGEASCLNAYCPHLGANLTVGGKVVGETLRCPFHLWEFSGSGKVCRVPYMEEGSRIPDVTRAASFSVVEYHGQICVWVDAENRPPAYELVRYKEIDCGDMVYHGTHDRVINMHLQEFAENSVDYAHFQPLHGQMKIPWTDIFVPGLTIRHSAKWLHGETDPAHIAYFLDHAQLEFMGNLIPNTDADATITFMGPGSVVTFDFQIPNLGRILMFQTHTPLSPVMQHVTFSWYAETCIPDVLVWYVVGNWIAQWIQDLMVWENKLYLRQPKLVKGDGPVGKLRRWCGPVAPCQPLTAPQVPAVLLHRLAHRCGRRAAGAQTGEDLHIVVRGRPQRDRVVKLHFLM